MKEKSKIREDEEPFATATSDSLGNVLGLDQTTCYQRLAFFQRVSDFLESAKVGVSHMNEVSR